MYTDPHTECTEVGWDNGRHSTGSLYTKGISGCNVIIARTLNGETGPIPGFMTHYTTCSVKGNMKKLRELTDKHKELLSGEKRVALFYELSEIRARKLKAILRDLLGEISVFKMIDYPVISYPSDDIPGAGNDIPGAGTMEFQVPTGKYSFTPFANKENPEFNGVL